MRKLSLVLALVVLAGATCAAAESFTVSMKGGNTFETRYRPQVASWDPTKIVVLTELGNRITLSKADVAGISAESENRGFGRVIDNTTLELGLAANDAPDPSEATDPVRALAQALQGQQTPTQSYDQKQFVEPSAVGGGIPVNWGQPGGVGSSGTPVIVSTPQSGGSTPPPQ